MIRLIATQLTVDAAKGEESPRTITGVAAPWNIDAVESGGARVRFLPGSLPVDGPAPKLLGHHDDRQVIGVVTERVSTDDGMMFTARVSKTQAGDEFLELAKDGAIDSVSVGAQPTKWTMEGDTMVIEAANWMELSMVPFPAFPEAAITQVAASAPEADTVEVSEVPDIQPTDNPEEPTMNHETPAVEAAAPSVIATAPIPAQPKRALRLPSPGEYIAAMKRGGADWHTFNANVTEAIRLATGDVLVADAAGVVPTPIVAPVYDDVNALRPIVSALGARSMPDAGATFIRPYVKVHSAAGAQSTELSALSTADFEVDDIVVTKKTFGGKLVLSEQVIDWSSPSIVDQAITDMAGQYALATEKYVVDQMAAAITNSQEVIITDYTDAAEVIADLYTAAAAIGATGNYLPNAIVMSPAMWAKWGGLLDTTERPIFPMTSPINSVGNLPQGVTAYNGNPLGLNLVVSNQIGSQAVGNKTATEYAWLMNTRAVEVYESYKGFLRDESVGTLGITLAVRGYFAAHVIDKTLIRILGPDATF